MSCGRVPAGQSRRLTDDAVLGGRLRLKQKQRGHRVGHDAILLAAATAARAGDRVGRSRRGRRRRRVWRWRCACPGVEVTLVEIDPELAAIAAENIARNGLDQRVRRGDARRRRAGATRSQPRGSGRARSIAC